MPLARILVATDFSEHAEVAARLAIGLAAGRDTAVSLLHVDQTPEALSGEAEPMMTVRPELWRQYRESSRRLVDDNLAGQVASLRRWAPDVAIETAVDYGDVAVAIERHARVWGASMIAMGSHGAAATERYLFGSVLTQLLPVAPCPVLVTRASQRDRMPEPHGFERPLVAIDYSRYAEPAARLAQAIAAPGAAIELVHVWRPPILLEAEGGPPLSPSDRRDLDAAADLALGRERERLDAFRHRALGEAPARCTVEQGRVASVLLDHARQQGSDVIVVGAHGPGPQDGIGSVTDRVLRHSPVPVLFVPRSATLDARVGERSGAHALASLPTPADRPHRRPRLPIERRS
jgi:nucleotide-binding universal stress UspA family protein